MLLHLGRMAASSFFLIAPEAQSGDTPWSSHAWIAIDDGKNDFDPCILFSSVLRLTAPDLSPEALQRSVCH